MQIEFSLTVLLQVGKSLESILRYELKEMQLRITLSRKYPYNYRLLLYADYIIFIISMMFEFREKKLNL